MIPRRRIPLRFSTLFEVMRELIGIAGSANEVEIFENEFARYLNVAHARATSSGRDALGLILDGLNLEPGDEIIIPSYTLGELLPLLQHRGLVLKPADIEIDSFNMSVDSIREQISDKTKCILVVHLHGAPCNIESIVRVANESDIAVIEDCAHAIGAEVKGTKVGAFGNAALFSLEVNKPVCAFGGGVVATNDNRLIEYLNAELSSRQHKKLPAIKKILIKHLEELFVRSPFYGPVARVLFSRKNAKKFEQAYRGANTKVRKNAVAFSQLQARLALSGLRELDKRNTCLNQLREEVVSCLPSDFIPQVRNTIGKPAFYNLVVRVTGDASEIRARALRLGLDLGLGSEIMDNTASMLGINTCENANTVAKRALLLPVYEGLTERRKNKVASTLRILSVSEEIG